MYVHNVQTMSSKPNDRTMPYRDLCLSLTYIEYSNMHSTKGVSEELSISNSVIHNDPRLNELLSYEMFMVLDAIRLQVPTLAYTYKG